MASINNFMGAVSSKAQTLCKTVNVSQFSLNRENESKKNIYIH